MKNPLFFIIVLFSALGFSQETLSDLLKAHNKHNIPYISVEELATPKTKAIILDARELKEYETSHLKNAIFIGYDTFNADSLQLKLPNKKQQIVVYCSLGIRSETIAAKLQKAGYENVYNLYGGIFEWKNKGFKVVNPEGKKTEDIHTFNKEWSKWLTKGNKIYE